MDRCVDSPSLLLTWCTRCWWDEDHLGLVRNAASQGLRILTRSKWLLLTKFD